MNRKKALLAIAAALVALLLALGGIAVFADEPSSGSGTATPTPVPTNPAKGGRHAFWGRGTLARFGLLSTVADTIGTTPEQVLQQLRDGKTLAQIAGDKESAVVDALLKPRADRVDQLLQEGRLTAAQADALKAYWRANLEDLMNQTFTFGGRGFRFGGKAAPTPTPTPGANSTSTGLFDLRIALPHVSL
jgi:hypothetical protein